MPEILHCYSMTMFWEGSVLKGCFGGKLVCNVPAKDVSFLCGLAAHWSTITKSVYIFTLLNFNLLFDG